MNLVVLSVIFLLWANNPVNKKVATDWAEVAVLMDTRINHFLATISPQLWWISGPILQTTNTFSYTHTLKYISKCRHSPDANLSGGPLAWPGRPQSCANKLMKHNIAPFASWYSATLCTASNSQQQAVTLLWLSWTLHTDCLLIHCILLFRHKIFALCVDNIFWTLAPTQLKTTKEGNKEIERQNIYM